MRIRIAMFICLLGFGTAYAQPAPDPTPPPPDAPPGQGEAEVPNFEMTPLQNDEALRPPESTGPGPGPRGEVAPEIGELPSATQTMGDDITADVQPQATGLVEAAADAIREDYPALSTGITVAVPEKGMLEVDGVVSSLGDKYDIQDSLTALPESDIVVNRISVQPPRRADTAIERDVRRTLRSDELLRNYPIRVDTRNQRVFLRGRVPTPLMAQTALRMASEVRGVRDVNIDRLQSNLP